MLVSLLRRHFGVRHLDLIPSRRCSAEGFHSYSSRDLDLDLTLHPFTRSIASHCIYPHQHYGAYDTCLKWFVFLRDPVERFISHYIYHVSKEGFDDDFDTWLSSGARANIQLRYIAGCHDLDVAKMIISEKLSFVGIVEYFNASLLLLRNSFGLENFNVDYPRKENTAQPSWKQKAVETLARHKDRVLELNALDIELYEWVLHEIWPQQLDDYGQARLTQDLQDSFVGARVSVSQLAQVALNRIVRNLFYKPIVRLSHR